MMSAAIVARNPARAKCFARNAAVSCAPLTRRSSDSGRRDHNAGGGSAEREVEGGAVVGGGVGPDPAAVAVDDARGGREADAGAVEVGRAVQAVERREQLVGARRVEAGAVVADEVRAGEGAELDPRRVALGGELPGVAQEV